MSQAIEERGGQLLVAGEDGDPFGKREIGRDDGRPSLVAIGDQIEEELAPTRSNGTKPSSRTTTASALPRSKPAAHGSALLEPT